MTEKFKKFDSEKTDYSLFEPTAMQMYCEVSQMGAVKYGRNNWKQATYDDRFRIQAAVLRHFMAYMSGEMYDQESGKSHLSHALWGLTTIRYLEIREEKKNEK
jgi:hypothetical protein